MFRIFVMLVLVAAGFVGGFFSGIEYHRNEIREDPMVFMQEFSKDFKEVAGEKYKKIKKIMMEK